MLEIVHKGDEKSSPDIGHNDSVNKVAFVGLLTSLDDTRAVLQKLKDNGSTNILIIKNDLIKMRSRMFQIFLRINSILSSYKRSFVIDGCLVDCDFCSNVARVYNDYHVWCGDCFKKEYGGVE